MFKCFVKCIKIFQLYSKYNETFQLILTLEPGNLNSKLIVLLNCFCLPKFLEVKFLN